MTLELRDLGRPGESLGEVMLGFAEALGADIENLRSDSATRIHDIRVGTKKLRALVRLAGDAIPPGVRDAVGADLREIRQAFAGSRDEQVMRHRLAELFSEDAPPVLAKLGLAGEISRVLPSAERPRKLAAALRARLAEIDFSAVTLKTLVGNAARSYRRARRLMHQCRTHPGDEVLMHEWRKRIKDVCYHALSLSAVTSMRKLALPLDALAESLGEYHDLTLIAGRASGQARIKAAMEQRKKKVARECFRAGKKIFRRKPSAFRKKLSAAIAG